MVETRARTGNLARASLVEARPDLLRELSPRRMVLVLSERLPRSGEAKGSLPERESFSPERDPFGLSDELGEGLKNRTPSSSRAQLPFLSANSDDAVSSSLRVFRRAHHSRPPREPPATTAVSSRIQPPQTRRASSHRHARPPRELLRRLVWRPSTTTRDHCRCLVPLSVSLQVFRRPSTTTRTLSFFCRNCRAAVFFKLSNALNCIIFQCHLLFLRAPSGTPCQAPTSAQEETSPSGFSSAPTKQSGHMGYSPDRSQVPLAQARKSSLGERLSRSGERDRDLAQATPARLGEASRRNRGAFHGIFAQASGTRLGENIRTRTCSFMQQASFPLAPFKYSSIHTISDIEFINHTCNSSLFTDYLETLKKGLASLTFPQQSPSKISSQQKNGTTSTLKELKGKSRHEMDRTAWGGGSVVISDCVAVAERMKTRFRD
ncbi:hypothetical protein DEO72_LG5g1047 [Vigna unguiculata]|uniref:Uncharacterized protein n=1 Tax=Vigna unguiculata TaxID=3917 RepID=A0A4D6LXA0_VIGUN|nr:hypothetical protein DEO72_LG5g1047 [Vigna unguiculata]